MNVALRYSDDPFALWDTFVAKWGPEVIERAYRLPIPGPGEEVWDVLVDECLAGWGSLTQSPSDRHPFLAVGIFPEYSGRGLRSQVKALLAEEARRQGALGVKTMVYLSNLPQLRRVMAESARGPYKYAGTIFLPKPGYSQFVWSFES